MLYQELSVDAYFAIFFLKNAATVFKDIPDAILVTYMCKKLIAGTVLDQHLLKSFNVSLV